MSFEPYRVRIEFKGQLSNPNNRMVHVVGEVEGQLVWKTWSKRRQEWMYEVGHPSYLAPTQQSR